MGRVKREVLKAVGCFLSFAILDLNPLSSFPQASMTKKIKIKNNKQINKQTCKLCGKNKTKTRGVSPRVLETSLNSRCGLDHTHPQILPAFPCFWWLLYSPEAGPISDLWSTTGPAEHGELQATPVSFSCEAQSP